MQFEEYLSRLKSEGNFRSIPSPAPCTLDLSTNDYMGFAADSALREAFFDNPANRRLAMTSSASRLLASNQQAYVSLELLLQELYGKPALLFNSGYHANTGLVSAMADPSDTVILADKLVHASIIDGMRLSGAPFERWRHNDVGHLERLMHKHRGSRLLVVAESVYSMDGDIAPLRELAALRQSHPDMLLYVDEAHAVGAYGTDGLGVCASMGIFDSVDILVGTFGKALASHGAFAVMAPTLRQVAVNRSRSLIFSTALPPMTAAWSEHVLRHSLSCSSLREQLQRKAALLRRLAGLQPGTYIVPFIAGSPQRAVALSQELLGNLGFKVLPIRTPTVPPGTDRLRISLNPNVGDAQIEQLAMFLNRHATKP